MDTSCEASPSPTVPTIQEDPPGPSVNVHEAEALSEVDNATGTEALKLGSFPSITQEMFENQFRKLINGESDDKHETRNFKGYPDKDKIFLYQYTDKKSEIIFDFYKKAISKHKESMLKSAKGRIPVPIASKSIKAYLISPKFLQKPVPNIPNNVSPTEKRDLKKKKKKKRSKPLDLNASDYMGHGDNSFSFPKPTQTTTSPSALSRRAARLIQTPKRYLDGEEQRPKTVKRRPRRKATDNLFEMGLLHPKYPKKLETSSIGVDADAIGPKTQVKNGSNNDTGGANAFFAISGMLHSGELQFVINNHHQEMAHKKRLEELELELRNFESRRMRNTSSSIIDLTKEIRHSSFQNPCTRTLEMERPAPPPPPSNSLTIIPLKVVKKPPPAPALVPIYEGSPKSKLKHSGSVVTVTTTAEPKSKAFQASRIAAGNKTRTQDQGIVGNISSNHTHSPTYQKIPIKMAKSVGIVGPFPQLPILTGKTFKQNATQQKSPKAIRQVQGPSKIHDSIPDFMMNFLGSRYPLSLTSAESGSRRMSVPPPRSFIWHPEHDEELIDDLGYEEANPRRMKFAKKCQV